MSGLISVVIPYYNNGDDIIRSVRSVKDQTVSVKEVIIIDDGSRKRPLNSDLIDKLKQLLTYSNIELNIILLEKNSGPSIARNRGIHAARAEYIAFLDADDSWHPKKIEIVENIIKKYNYSVNIIGHKMAQLSTAEDIKCYINLINSATYINISIKRLLFKNYYQTSTVVIKKIEHLLFDENLSYSEDYRLWLEYSLYSNKGVYIKEILAFMYKPPYGIDGLSSNLIDMEKYEIKNLIYVFKKAKDLKIKVLVFFAIPFSLIKFLRRILITKINKGSK